MRIPSSSALANNKTSCCSKVEIKRGPWTAEEDEILSDYVKREGEGRWRTLPKRAGLQRCGKSCRLRWMNYLRPSIKRGHIGSDEEDLILRLHRLLGNRWSLIAGRIPGRTDNEIKNYWNTYLSKKLISLGLDPRTHKPLNPSTASSTAYINNVELTSYQPPQSIHPNVLTLEKVDGSQCQQIPAIKNVGREIGHKELLHRDAIMTEDGNWNFYDAVSMNSHIVISQFNTVNKEDMLSSIVETLMDDNYEIPHQWSSAIIPPPFTSVVPPATNFYSQDGIWNAELVKSALECQYN
ncbi:hypothetical protein SAY87_020318 [Trapa incisa]|uniref:Uncharacterized protein n=1 Tax=Trapa incisa TaxID=236973 RepID=A0AAN7Q3N0_9MYRT|nr:hypothetical protein SAY87_020318 [Trapa incisa]